MTTTAAVDRDWFMARIEALPSGCWQWIGPRRQEYGVVSFRNLDLVAHRVAYELLVTPIPAGKQIDHLCRVPLCVNPTHLEPVTQRENILRGQSFAAVNARKTHCPKGHAYIGDNVKVRTDGGRRCRACYGAARHPDTHCLHGHAYTPDNTYIRPKRATGRECRTCRRLLRPTPLIAAADSLHSGSSAGRSAPSSRPGQT